MPKTSEYTSIKSKICICYNKYKTENRKETTFKENNKNKYSLLLHQCIPELKRNSKGMDMHDAIEIDQDGIEISKLISSICHLQDDDKQYGMVMVESDKQVYLFYQPP